MEKRALVAVVLSIAVFYLFSAYFGPKQQPVTPPTAVKEEKAVQQPAIQPAPTPAPVALLPPPVTAVQDVTVETVRYTAVFTGAGGALKSLTLKDYREKNSPDSPKVVLATKADPALLTFSTAGAGFALSPQAVYAPSVSSLELKKGESKQLVFTHISTQGYVVRKTYSLHGDGYGMQLETQLINNSQAPLVGSLQQIISAPFEVNTKDSRYETYGSTLFAEKSLHTNAPKDVASAAKKYEKPAAWSGITDKYFLTAILAEQGSIASVEIRKSQAGYLESIAATPQLSVAPGQAVAVQHRLFVGPKDIDILKAQGSDLEQSLDLGWFTVLAKPMLHALKFFYGYIPNFGVGIIIITVILKILFFPLTHKSYKSMKDMSKIQPKMVALKEKYKNDKEAMNRAVMELYREHKVNPLGGCLPMLVQIPVFFALYKALMFSIELRHAPFMLWITDLSDKDPYYITPILMGATMFIQQKMTPSNMDEMQQKIMLALPVVFTFMFLTFPSGLVLYWLINNILTIGQQMYINKLVKD
ncbi:membrane protein insertase YidC [Trichlorobacter ammonificans]|uniref:Membrane protein insertase YidC n=1 Tax=Trichlorobacter ammonificans TaxID=2916410 RepID=A0ABN8HNV4_9BACT|nr:membrane protein insertase YidC [Trichlorobacter ammonificans]CAH2032714.1 Membrane protein insertase YidC [Trichlorobacter ammonificans]